MLVEEIDSSRFMVQAPQMKGENLKEKSTDWKRSRMDDGDFLHSRSGWGNLFQGKGSNEKMIPKCKECGGKHKVGVYTIEMGSFVCKNRS